MTVKLYNQDGDIFDRYTLVEKITYQYNECGRYTNLFLDCGSNTYRLTINDENADRITIKLEV